MQKGVDCRAFWETYFNAGFSDDRGILLEFCIKNLRICSMYPLFLPYRKQNFYAA
jgi:hypothetical protein